MGLVFAMVVGFVRRPWPLVARVPVVAGALILVVVIVVAHLMLAQIDRDEDRGFRRLASVYLGGITTLLYPHIQSGNVATATEALHRSMWLQNTMRERRAMVVSPDGHVFVDVASNASVRISDDPLNSRALQQALKRGNGFTFDRATGVGWAFRSIDDGQEHVADLYVALELSPLLADRRTLGHQLLAIAVIAGLLAAAVGVWVVHRMIAPIQRLTDRLEQARGGAYLPVPEAELPPASTEYGRLLRSYNEMVAAIDEREAMAARLAQQERESLLGRLSATLAHEIRNPLAGMTTALSTARKYGNDAAVRTSALDLLERGLHGMRDVVGSVLGFHRAAPAGRALEADDLDDLRRLVEPEAQRRDLRLVWSADVPRHMAVDATHTRQVALNLLLNACAASPVGGEVHFHAAVQFGPGLDAEILTLDVADRGLGLPPDVAMALRTHGAPPPHARPGLGISVVRDVVAQLGGRITLQATPDGGTSIRVSLPVAQSRKTAA